MVVTWIAGLVRRRRARLAAVAIGTALAVALVAAIGSFVAASRATMTRRSAAQVAVDWQVELEPGTDVAHAIRTVTNTQHVRAVLPVGYAATEGLSPADGSRQTRAGLALGLPRNYGATFPQTMRLLAGTADGVLVSQSAAADARVAPGDTVIVQRNGLPGFPVRVDGIVELRAADALFQLVGLPASAQPSAPPDSIVLLPSALWDELAAPLRAARPDLVHQQLHVRLDHQLPPDPAAAFDDVTGQANNLELRLAGTGRVADNLATTLDAARSDAAYAQLVFLFLGIPGAVVAGLLTAMVATASGDRRRREQALLRARGVTTGPLLSLAFGEALVAGVCGCLVGLGAAAVIGRLAFGSAGFGATTTSAIVWAALAVFVGLATATAAIVGPAWRDSRHLTVARARRELGASTVPHWERLWLDGWLLAAGAVVFWLTSRSGHQLVLAPEGVSGISVDYSALAGPALVWAGASLFAWRCAEFVLRRGRRAITATLQPVSGSLAGTIAASMSRQRRMLARGVVLVALAAGFVSSTAIFNATYRHQARVDALLTNGADVAVSYPPGAAGVPLRSKLAAIPGVQHVEPLAHQYAYVGPDLQDIYGVDPGSIVAATKLQDSYFTGATADALMKELVRKPSGALVSAETAHDFRLRVGDPITLRVRDQSGSLVPVRFRFVGIVNEFPTAPHDSFVVANRGYIMAQTGRAAADTYLVDTGGQNRRAVAARARTVVGPTGSVADLDQTQLVVGSSLTAVDLGGLTKVELGFGVALMVAATGLVLWIGFAERRRSFAIITMLGARRRALAGLVWSEALFVGVGGLLAGAVAGFVLSHMLVKVLTGVFDPPPSALSVPWGYLALVAAIAAAATAVAAWRALVSASRPAINKLREL